MAQSARIPRPIDGGRRLALAGNVSPRAKPEYEQGRVPASQPLSYVTLELGMTAAQRADLESLLAAQQTPGSPSYHHWLTPEEYADRFGVSQPDISLITGWLQSQGLAVAAVARARNWVAVNGSAGQVERAFGVELHHYLVDGETHFANPAPPTLPEALAGVVTHIRGLNDFRMKPASRPMPLPAGGVSPRYTSAKGNHYLAPGDLATIYNISPILNSGIDGTGQKIVIAGQTAIDLTDIQQFRAMHGLGARDPKVLLVPNTSDPGTVSGDLAEADIDIEWSGAVARNATIVYVYSPDVMQSVQYAIDQNLAPVISTSYGLCELEMSRLETQSLQTWARQANALGITWLAASGDTGGADCNDSRNPGPAVDVPASIPEVTGVGGTEFLEGAGQYWSAANDANRASALSYIPEVVWNDSILDGTPSAGGGGASALFNQPSWQLGAGVPVDGARHVPDISMAASADHDGYLVYTSGSLQVYGGTSVPAPAFAGLAALLNHYLIANGAQSTPGLGNINPRLYSLAQTAGAAFHDITAGDNIVTVKCTRTHVCSNAPAGFPAGPGYDQASGLGSVNADQLFVAWATGTASHSTPSPAIGGVTNGASFQQAYAPGAIVSIFGAQLAVSTGVAGSVPLPAAIAGASVTVNGIAAPLYYASPSQLNAQVPYETGAGSAVLTVNNGGQTVSRTIIVSTVAPGIFTDQNGTVVPFGSAARGQTITLFVTGAGAVAPAVATGAAPASSTPLANLPKPLLNTTVSVGGVNAPIAFIGIPPALVGVLQINYQVPSQAPLGAQPVIVAVGGVSSPPATLVVTN